MQCEANVTTRRVGRCRMKIAGPGRKYCKFHDPELKPQTMAAAKRKIEAYWERRRASGQASSELRTPHGASRRQSGAQARQGGR
jgi:hypothetical protein